MRVLLILLMIFITSVLKAQDGYVFTKEQHDQIRKNLADYKILIKDFDNLSADLNKYKYKVDSLNRQFALYRELHSKTNAEAKRFQVLYENSDYENKKLKNQVEILKKKLLDIEPEMARKDRMVIHWKAKYAHERRYDRGDRIAANFVFGTMVGCGIIAVVSAIKNHTL